MDLLTTIENMPESVYLKLKQAVELGKWDNGIALSNEQKSTCLQTVMAWQAKHLNSTEHFTIGSNGQIIEQSKAELKREMAEQQIIRFNSNDF
ncbi:DUF1315 family protein [Catenovulum sp. 2E275]|uniref:YeaC family protein n=1 Tax=Catenovulum sp. 2E275 TaxID=2980497 RepID=UPI0021CEA1B7|nr:DUF1315 family protein [Catenovulum sp. 2E275]MCU4677165.1 DUF1315 family protein [Catenovulum sp. 2E275]